MEGVGVAGDGVMSRSRNRRSRSSRRRNGGVREVRSLSVLSPVHVSVQSGEDEA